MVSEAIAEAASDVRRRALAGKSAHDTSRSISDDLAAPITGSSTESEWRRFIENALIADATYDRVLAMQPPLGRPLTYPHPPLGSASERLPKTPTAATLRSAHSREKQGYFVFQALPPGLAA